MKPLIGIVYCGFTDQKMFVSAPYVEAIDISGGIPIIIPYTPIFNNIASYINFCDGFLFCGGDDITPLLFGEELLTNRGKTDQKTDVFHLNLMRQILHSGLPLLGICRGMQVLNLALGGTIYQDISLRPRKSLNHMQLSCDRSDICHKITLSEDSMLYKFCGKYFDVNSFHHQCIKNLGKDMKLAAVASDGVIEAIESSSHPFVLGVQWHPECMLGQDIPMQHLFLDFIKKSEQAKNISII